MSSLWNRSGTIERYADDIRAAGAKAYFFLGGTTTPLAVYQDSGEASAFASPVLADAHGRWPDVFVPYVTSYDVQVKTAAGVQLTYTVQIPNPNPVEVDVTVAPENTVQTGMIHAEMVNTTKAGFVRLNGRTIGNSSSSGSERSNADTEDLFAHLWNNLTDTIAPVSSGRGGSAAADFAANKTIGLPNWQGAVPIGLDDMGASAGSFFTGLTFAVGDAITAGSRTGANGTTITVANLPVHAHTGTTATEGAHTHSGTTDAGGDHTHSFSATTSSDGSHSHTINISDPGHTHTINRDLDAFQNFGTNLAAQATGPGSEATASNTTGITASSVATGAHTHSFSGTTGSSSTHTHTFTTGAGTAHSHTFTSDSVGSGTPFNNLPRSILVTWFIKL